LAARPRQDIGRWHAAPRSSGARLVETSSRTGSSAGSRTVRDLVILPRDQETWAASVPWTWPRSSAAAAALGRRYSPDPALWGRPAATGALGRRRYRQHLGAGPVHNDGRPAHPRRGLPRPVLLGMGVSHTRLVEGLCGHQYERPWRRCVATWTPWTRRRRPTGPS